MEGEKGTERETALETLVSREQLKQLVNCCLCYRVLLVHQESSRTKKSTPSFPSFLLTVSADMRLYMEYTSFVRSLHARKSRETTTTTSVIRRGPQMCCRDVVEADF